MPVFNLRGKTVTIPDDFTMEQRLQSLRYQAPEVYRELILGQSPDMELFREEARTQGAQQVAEETSPAMAGLVGVGNTMTSIGRGARTLGNRAIGNKEGVESIQELRADDAESVAAMRGAHPVASFVGESVPYMAAPQGMLGAGARMVGRGAGLTNRAMQGNKLFRAATGGVADAAAVGGATEFIESGGDLEAAARGAGLGAAGNILGRSLFARKPTPAGHPGVKSAQAAGIQLAPSERFSETPFIRNFEHALENWPIITSGAGKRIRKRNQNFMDKSLRQALGAPENFKITKNSLGALADDIDQTFSVYPVKNTPEVWDELSDIAARETSISGAVPNPQVKVIDRIMESLDDGGMLEGPQMAKVLKELDVLIDKKGGAVSRAYEDVKKVLVSAVRAQQGELAGDTVLQAMERASLARAARDKMLRGKDGIVDYKGILQDFYRKGSRPVTSPTGMKQLLEKAEPFPEHAFGLRPRDLAEHNIVGNLLTSPAGGALLGSMMGPAGALTLGASGPVLGGLHYGLGAIPRVLDRGAGGALFGARATQALNPVAERVGRGAVMGSNQENRR